MSEPAPLLYALLLHGVQGPDSLRASEKGFLSEAGAHVAGRGSRFVGDAIEKGQTGPDRRHDLSGSPLFLILTPLAAAANAEDVKRAAAAFDRCATHREAWLLRERFKREERKPLGEVPWLQLVMMNVEQANEDEFNDWYETEHVARIAAVAPEFVGVQRLEAIEGAPRHHALWRLTERKAPERDPWLSASETPWTARIRRFMRDRRRYLLAPLAT